MVSPGWSSSSILPSLVYFSVSLVAGRMWNWMSGPERSGRDLQKAAIWAAERVSRPLRWNRYFSVSPRNRAPRVSSFTETTPALSRQVARMT